MKLMPFVAIHTDLDCHIQREDKEGQISCDTSYAWNLKKKKKEEKDTNLFINTRQKQL